MYQVAKAIITVDGGPSPHTQYLLSVKRDAGSRCEGRLEFIGGRFDPGELPRQALVRELAEEEATGRLADLAVSRANLFFTLSAGGAHHFLFPFRITIGEYETLRHHPGESFGYCLVREPHLKPCPVSLTDKTNRILERWLPLHAEADAI